MPHTFPRRFSVRSLSSPFLAFGLGAALWLFGGACALAEPAALSNEEKEAGFQLLFNGVDLKGWQHTGNWEVVEGTISRKGKGGSLVYTVEKVPDDFELRFEWKVASGSNSGVYYRPGQYEYQILDNAKHPDGQNPRTSAASIYFCCAPCEDATNPVGEWNQGRIVCQGTVIQHWLNGKKVIDLDYADSKWAEHVELLRKRGGDLKARGAMLNLQDHGDPVWYRSLRWKNLDGKAVLDRTPVTPAAIPEAARKKEQAILESIQRGKAAAKK